MNLDRALLYRANLTRAQFRGANLTHALLAEANLTGAHFDLVDLTRVGLSRANLTSARLEGAWMEASQANRALHVDRAVLPAHLVWDPDLGAGSGGHRRGAATTETRHRELYPWLFDDPAS